MDYFDKVNVKEVVSLFAPPCCLTSVMLNVNNSFPLTIDCFDQYALSNQNLKEIFWNNKMIFYIKIENMNLLTLLIVFLFIS